MNKRRQPSNNRYKRIKRLVYFQICAILFFGATHFAECLELDLLKIPSVASDRAESSILMDVKRVDSRMVAVGEWGHILNTKTTCKGWFQAQVPVSVALTAVYFPNSTKGWAVGHEGVVLHTEDGGGIWVKQLDGNQINKLVYDQLVQLIKDRKQFLEDQKGSMTVAAQKNLENEIEDLGFFLSDAKMALREGPTRPLMDVWFKNEQEGIIVGVFGMILKTSDGGKSWEPMLDRIENPNGYHYNGIFRSGENLFIAGEMGLLFRSKDFGKTWEQLRLPYDGSFFGVIGDPEGTFVITFGLRGNVCYSLDGGEVWQHKSVGRSSFSGGTWLSDNRLCLVAVDGSIYISPDKGETFKVLSEKFPSAISAAQSGDDELTVIGLNGLKKIHIEK